MLSGCFFLHKSTLGLKKDHHSKSLNKEGQKSQKPIENTTRNRIKHNWLPDDLVKQKNSSDDSAIGKINFIVPSYHYTYFILNLESQDSFNNTS